MKKQTASTVANDSVAFSFAAEFIVIIISCGTFPSFELLFYHSHAKTIKQQRLGVHAHLAPYTERRRTFASSRWR
jgi:hypothetical protein